MRIAAGSAAAGIAAAGIVAVAVTLAPVQARAPVDLVERVRERSGDPLDAALGGDRALLSLLPADVRSGRYTMPVREFRVDKPALRRDGVFWRTESGNAYTRVEPYDEELVRREVRAIDDHFARKREKQRAAAIAAGRDPDAHRKEAGWDYDKVSPLGEGVPIYDGSEYQWPVWKVFVPALMPDLSMRVHMEDEACSDAVDAVVEAIRAEVNALEPDFRPAGARDRWTVDVAPLRAATEGAADAARRACRPETEGGMYELDDARAVVFERWRTGVEFRIKMDVPDDEGEGVVHVTPGDVGPPPERPEPAPSHGSDGMHEFLLAIAACGALPWEYTDFAATRTYARPYSEHFGGPSSMMRPAWVCEPHVPPAAKREADGRSS